jgi:NAD+ diphosphatase
MQLAEAFRFCPRCGVAVSDVGKNPLRCSACRFTFYFSPVTGVVCIIANPAGEVLLLVRGREPGKGKYGLPGGFVDPGESAHEAAVREVREEIALEVARLDYLGSFPNRYEFGGVTIPVTDIIYRCHVARWEGLQLAAGEIDDVRIVRPGPEELSQMAFESNRRGLELYLNSQAATPTRA